MQDAADENRRCVFPIINYMGAMNQPTRVRFDMRERRAYFRIAGNTVKGIDQAVIINTRLLNTESSRLKSVIATRSASALRLRVYSAMFGKVAGFCFSPDIFNGPLAHATGIGFFKHPPQFRFGGLSLLILMDQTIDIGFRIIGAGTADSFRA
jgi:hypothetical protein